MDIPKINKKVTDFFIGEEGSISKDKLIKTGIIIAGVAISAGITSATHTNECGKTQTSDNTVIHANSITLTKDLNNAAVGTHCNGTNSHSSHGSHGSHSSHGSHGSHNSW